LMESLRLLPTMMPSLNLDMRTSTLVVTNEY
jgi:hypothetical protein